MRTPITPSEVKKLQDAGKLSVEITCGGNNNFEIWENETGKALFRERTNCGFNDKYRWVFMAKVSE